MQVCSFIKIPEKKVKNQFFENRILCNENLICLVFLKEFTLIVQFPSISVNKFQVIHGFAMQFFGPKKFVEKSSRFLKPIAFLA